MELGLDTSLLQLTMSKNTKKKLRLKLFVVNKLNLRIIIIIYEVLSTKI